MGGGKHGGFGNTIGASYKKDGNISKDNLEHADYKLSESDQSKHIIGSDNYQKGKSIFIRKYK